MAPGSSRQEAAETTEDMACRVHRSRPSNAPMLLAHCSAQGAFTNPFGPPLRSMFNAVHARSLVESYLMVKGL
jgi:hypothetical protein